MRSLLRRIKNRLMKIAPIAIFLIKFKYSFKKNREKNKIIKKNISEMTVCENNKLLDAKNVAIFAIHCTNGRISDSTFFYLKELNKIFDCIIVVSDSTISSTERNRIRKLCGCIIYQNHNEYDFGSYKRGLKYIYSKGLNKKIQNLLLCNDSVYGPLSNLKTIIESMNALDCDFWGLIENSEIRKHLQSWFIYFKKNVISTNDLFVFLDNVKEEEIVWDIIIKYETQLTKYLVKKGFTYKAFLPTNEKTINNLENKTLTPLWIIKNNNFPFIKKKVFKGNYDKFDVDKIQLLEYIKKRNKTIYNLIISEN